MGAAFAGNLLDGGAICPGGRPDRGTIGQIDMWASGLFFCLSQVIPTGWLGTSHAERHSKVRRCEGGFLRGLRRVE